MPPAGRTSAKPRTIDKKAAAPRPPSKNGAAARAASKNGAKSSLKKRAGARVLPGKVAVPKGLGRKKPTREEKLAVFARLRALHADAHCELVHRSPFELLCATVLSAQTTDVAVNKVTPALFAAYPDASTMARAAPVDLEAIINRIGMYRQKAKNLVGLAQRLVGDHGGQVPQTLAELVELPGVGRKTANVVLGVAFGKPEGVVVDTHVQRISQRLGWTEHTMPPEIERDLCELLPRSEWDPASHVLIFHGRRVCFAIRPDCAGCAVNDACPSAFQADGVGRKPKRVRAS